jgi:hypothetical protein
MMLNILKLFKYVQFYREYFYFILNNQNMQLKNEIHLLLHSESKITPQFIIL